MLSKKLSWLAGFAACAVALVTPAVAASGEALPTPTDTVDRVAKTITFKFDPKKHVLYIADTSHVDPQNYAVVASPYFMKGLADKGIHDFVLELDSNLKRFLSEAQLSDDPLIQEQEIEKLSRKITVPPAYAEMYKETLRDGPKIYYTLALNAQKYGIQLHFLSLIDEYYERLNILGQNQKIAAVLNGAEQKQPWDKYQEQLRNVGIDPAQVRKYFYNLTKDDEVDKLPTSCAEDISIPLRMRMEADIAKRVQEDTGGRPFAIIYGSMHTERVNYKPDLVTLFGGRDQVETVFITRNFDSFEYSLLPPSGFGGQKPPDSLYFLDGPKAIFGDNDVGKRLLLNYFKVTWNGRDFQESPCSLNRLFPPHVNHKVRSMRAYPAAGLR